MGRSIFDPELILNLRTSIVDEISSMMRKFRADRPEDDLYVFGLYAYVDWSTPALFYGWNTEQKLAKTVQAKTEMPADYYKWKAVGYWDDTGNLGASNVIDEIVESSGLEDMDDDEQQEKAQEQLAELCELQLLLALKDADEAGLFGTADKRHRVTLLVSDQDEGSCDDWRLQVTSRLLNPDEVCQRFLRELQRAIRKPDLSDVELQKLMSEIDKSPLAKRFHEAVN